MNNEYRDIVSHDGTVLKSVIRENGSSKWLIVTHGLGEHSARHEYILKLFSQNFNIAIYDLRGHGKSGGKRGNVDSFKDYLKDLQAVIDYLRKHFSMTSYSLFGHSLGGLITSSYMQNMVSENFYPEKVYLSSPAVASAGIMGPLFSNAPKFLLESLLKLPTLPIEGVINLRKLSHDSRVYQAYIKDDLNLLKVQTKLYFEILNESRDVFSRPLRVKCPLYVSIGTEDALVNSGMVIDYFRNIEKNAQLKIFPGGYHELHNEVEKYRKPYLNFLRQSLTGLSFE